MASDQRHTEEILDDLLVLLKEDDDNSSEDFKKPKLESGIWKCNICSREYSCLHNLKRHKKIHTREKPQQSIIQVVRGEKLSSLLISQIYLFFFHS